MVYNVWSICVAVTKTLDINKQVRSENMKKFYSTFLYWNVYGNEMKWEVSKPKNNEKLQFISCKFKEISWINVVAGCQNNYLEKFLIFFINDF